VQDFPGVKKHYLPENPNNVYISKKSKTYYFGRRSGGKKSLSPMNLIN